MVNGRVTPDEVLEVWDRASDTYRSPSGVTYPDLRGIYLGTDPEAVPTYDDGERRRLLPDGAEALAAQWNATHRRDGEEPR